MLTPDFRFATMSVMRPRTGNSVGMSLRHVSVYPLIWLWCQDRHTARVWRWLTVCLSIAVILMVVDAVVTALQGVAVGVNIEADCLPLPFAMRRQVWCVRCMPDGVVLWAASWKCGRLYGACRCVCRRDTWFYRTSYRCVLFRGRRRGGVQVSPGGWCIMQMRNPHVNLSAAAVRAYSCQRVCQENINRYRRVYAMPGATVFFQSASACGFGSQFSFIIKEALNR